jgi:hypothetical protein
MSRTTRFIKFIFCAPHLFLLKSCLLQFLIPQALYPSLLASFLNQVGITVPFARRTHDLLLLHDQPTYA